MRKYKKAWAVIDAEKDPLRNSVIFPTRSEALFYLGNAGNWKVIRVEIREIKK